MLKLMRFPRGTNRNRILKRQRRANLEEEVDSAAKVERLFRRFWHERTMIASHHEEALGQPLEEQEG